MELVSGLAVPAVVLIAAVIMLFPRLSGGDGTGIFASGARRGFESAVSLLPMLVLLNMTVSLFSASGLADALAAAFAPLAEMLGVPSEILPLINDTSGVRKRLSGCFCGACSRSRCRQLPGAVRRRDNGQLRHAGIRYSSVFFIGRCAAHPPHISRRRACDDPLHFFVMPACQNVFLLNAAPETR